jgi:hypothetical protein
MTVDVQPLVNGRARQTDGTYKPLQMPVLLDCPILWQGGGGVTLTFPIKQGDECLIIVASRCIDGWYEAGPDNGPTDPPEFRMHNLSDGFALVGVKSLPKSWTVDSVATLRSDDNSTYVQLDPTGQAVKITAPGGVNINGVTIDSSGNVNSPATITATTDVIGGGKSLKSHTHNVPNVQGGSSTLPTLAPT